MKNVYLFEINDVLTNQIKLPYSTGLIWSHCLLNEHIKKNYKLDGWFYYRQEEEEILSQIENPSVVGFNCFVWNWKFNKNMARMIKEKYPSCVIVFGGWQPPMSDRSQNFFKDHSYVDIIAHGEGEITFEDILLENLKEEPQWKDVSGCSLPMRLVPQNERSTHRVVKAGLKLVDTKIVDNVYILDTYVSPPRQRIENLSSMPSPYLNGLFDELAKTCPYELEATIETTRGCPYRCTYCEINTLYYQKIKTHKLEKIYKEIDWISDNKVIFVYNADSNFGMLPEHLDITKYMVKKKKESGYPDKHRCDWAKNKADKVLELAKIFYETEMDKGITIAVQSMNPDTLKAIKRKNVDNGKLREFLQLYNQEDLPSYMELILGLPEETLGSFVDGICQILDLEQHNYIGIYPLTALPNTPFGEPEYINKYGLKVIETFTAFNHFDVSEQNEYEREHMVVASNTMTHEEYKECHIWRWIFMFGHYLGTLQFISRFLNKNYGISYRDFYGNLYDFMMKNPDTFLGKEMKKTRESVDNVMSAIAPWGRVVDEVRPNFAWDFEEATVIVAMKNKEKFYNEVAHHMQTCYNINNELLKNLIKYQDFSILDPSKTYPIRESFDYNIHDVIYNGEELKNEAQKITFKAKNYNGDYFKWGKEILWWGRRVASCKTKTEVIGV